VGRYNLLSVTQKKNSTTTEKRKTVISPLSRVSAQIAHESTVLMDRTTAMVTSHPSATSPSSKLTQSPSRHSPLATEWHLPSLSSCAATPLGFHSQVPSKPPALISVLISVCSIYLEAIWLERFIEAQLRHSDWISPSFSAAN
jgi:hypothetical protein